MVKRMDDKLDLNAHKVFDLLLEEIYGNVSTVYHRCDTLSKLESIIQKTYRNRSHIHLSNYNSAFYTTYDMKSQKNEIGNKNDMKKTYGNYIIKFIVKGLHNFIFTSYEQYKKIDPRATKEDYAEKQVEKLLPKIDTETKKELVYRINHNDHVAIGNTLEKCNLIGRIKGLEYNGGHDGNCLLIFDYTSLVPISYTKNEGKTWNKIYEKKYISNLKNNDNNDENVSILYDKNGWKLISAKNKTAVRKLVNKYWSKSSNQLLHEFDFLNINSIRSVYFLQQDNKNPYFIYLGENLKSGREDNKSINPNNFTGMRIYTKDSKGDRVSENINNFLKEIPDEILKLIKMDDTGNNLYSLKEAPKRTNSLSGFTNKKTTTIPEIRDAKKTEIDIDFEIPTEITDKYGSIIRADANNGNVEVPDYEKNKYPYGVREQEFLETGKYPKEKAKSLNKKAYVSYYYFKNLPEVYVKATIAENPLSIYNVSSTQVFYAFNKKQDSNSKYKKLFSFLKKAVDSDNQKAKNKHLKRKHRNNKDAIIEKKREEFFEIFSKKISALGLKGDLRWEWNNKHYFPTFYEISNNKKEHIFFSFDSKTMKYDLITKKGFNPPKETLEKIQEIIKEMTKKVVTLFADEIQFNRQNNLNKYNMFEEVTFFNY